MNIGQRIKNRRKELKLSVDELASRLGKDRSTIYRYENGDIENLPLDVLAPIANVLDTTPGYLMGWEDITEETKKDNDVIANVVARMSTDHDFFEIVESIYSLDSEKIKGLSGMLKTFL